MELINSEKLSEKDILAKVDKMCIESLCPETFQKWEEVKKMLTYNRKDLRRIKYWDDSPNVKETEYFEDIKALKITFKNEKSYLYKDVPLSIWDSLIQTKSIGSFINREIKGYYRYEQI